MVLIIYGYHPAIDVESMLHEGARHLLHLESPYGGSTRNVYSPEDTARFYSPELVDGDRITLGYPYLPTSLLLAVAGHLVGDVRLAALACVLASAAIVRRLADDATGRALAVMLVASPLKVAIVANFWVEPVVVLFLALAVLGLREDRPVLAAVGTGLLLASKQYLVVAAPVLLVLRRVRSGTVAARSVAVAAACCAPFLLAGPGAFVSDVVRAQLLQPYRPDSVSLLVVLGNALGQPPSWITGPLPLLAGLAVSALVARHSRLDPATALAATVGLSLLATVLLSKQAFANYYFVVAAALVVTAVAWPGSRRADEPDQAEVGSATPASTMRTESSMPGRGE